MGTTKTLNFELFSEIYYLYSGTWN